MTYAFTTTDSTFTLNGVSRKRTLEENGKPIVILYDTFIYLRIFFPQVDINILNTDTVTINGTAVTGTLAQKFDAIKYSVIFNESPASSGVVGAPTLTSPDGSVWTLSVSNLGVLSQSKP